MSAIPSPTRASDKAGHEVTPVMDFRNSYFYAVFWKSFRRNRFAVTGGAVVAILFAISLLAPFITPWDPAAINAYQVLTPPSATHWMGTDELGRDVFSRVIYGARISLYVGFVAVGISLVIGVMIGLASGFYGGWIDAILMRFVDIMLCFPTFFLILAMIALLEPSIWIIMLVIGVTSWMWGGPPGAGGGPFHQGAGLHHGRSLHRRFGHALIFRHILPNAAAPMLVAATLGVGGAILTESALSFLGIGVQPPIPSWGNILTSGKDYLEFAWWLSLFPGLAILVTVLAYNLLGEGIRDALDPRLHR